MCWKWVHSPTLRLHCVYFSVHSAELCTFPATEEFTYAGTEEGPFLARVKPVAFGQVRSKGSTQIIQSDKGVVDNIAEFTLFGKPGERVLASIPVAEF